MPAKDRPNSAPGLPVLFPPWLDPLQIKYMNPAVRRIARFLPTFAVIKHRGRKSGRSYETVVNAYRKGSVLAILLGHGKADWVKNVLAAGEADVRLFGRDLHITNLRVVPAGTGAKGCRGLPGWAGAVWVCSSQTSREIRCPRPGSEPTGVDPYFCRVN